MRFPSFVGAQRILVLTWVLALWLMLTGSVLAAEHGQAASNPEATLPYLLGVYTVTWLAFFAYAFYITRRQRELRRQIDELRRQLEEKKG